MNFNLNDLVVALSHALDFMEIDLLGGITRHSKRVAYLAVRMAENRGLPPERIADLLSLAILHDNGIGVAFQGSGAASYGSGETSRGEAATPSGAEKARRRAESGRRHCEAGEANLRGYPFLTEAAGVILNHHEQWDGSGFFGLSGEEIPWMSRVIRLADAVELRTRLDGIDYAGKLELGEWLVRQSGRAFDPELVDAFVELSRSPSFWLDLQGEFIGPALHRRAPRFERELSLGRLREATGVFSRIIDSKSRFTRLHSQELSARAARMARRYGFGEEKAAKLQIAADLHDVGKLAVSNAILDKPGKLEPPELDEIRKHTYYTRVSLEPLAGLEDIAEWAANHHEKLDGSGYPFGFAADRLDFESRLLACLDIYQALVEVRPYREALGHGAALSIMHGMAEAGKIDAGIVEDVDAEFAGDEASRPWRPEENLAGTRDGS